MAFIVDEETGNITLIQGDSGRYTIENVPCDKHYTAYFGVYNNKRKQIGFEVSVEIPPYNDGQVVYDNDLFCWSYSSSELFTLDKSPSVNDDLYNSDNEETEYTVASINSIVVDEKTYTRNSENNTAIEETTFYAWDNETNVIYTLNENPKEFDNVYNNTLEIIGFISSIGSIIIDSNEYLRNKENDIKKSEAPEVLPTTSVDFPIPSALTDYLTVKQNEDTAEYYFGIKLCSDDNEEDTLLLGDSQIGDLNTITVYPKKLEGIITNG